MIVMAMRVVITVRSIKHSVTISDHDYCNIMAIIAIIIIIGPRVTETMFSIVATFLCFRPVGSSPTNSNL